MKEGQESTVSDEVKQDDRASQLTAERLAAERAYNDALAEVDGSIPAFRGISPASARPGGHGAEALEPRWEIMREDGAGAGGLKALIKKVLRLPFAGSLRRQQAFNQSVASYGASLDATLVQLNDQMQALARFHHHLVQYMQKVWPLVDTNYRHQMVVESGLAAYVEAVNATNALRWETTQARDRRAAASMDEIRTTMANVQQTGAVLKRELERVLSSGVPAGSGGPQASTAAPTPTVRTAANPDAVNAFKYVGFEDKFRGSEDDIHARQEVYLPLFDGASDVLDLGCGRGEFLAALGARGVSGRGLDINHEMVELCHGRGLQVDEGDALAYLEGLPDGSLGGLFAAQVVEHFQPGYLTRLLDVAFLKLRPGSRIVLETLNPACWSAFFDSYIRDVTHAWPLHPDTLKYLVTGAGFQRIDVRYLAPYAPENKLQQVAVGKDTTPSAVEKAVIDTINANVNRLNSQLFSNRDYAVIGERL